MSEFSFIAGLLLFLFFLVINVINVEFLIVILNFIKLIHIFLDLF